MDAHKQQVSMSQFLPCVRRSTAPSLRPGNPKSSKTWKGVGGAACFYNPCGAKTELDLKGQLGKTPRRTEPFTVHLLCAGRSHPMNLQKSSQ